MIVLYNMNTYLGGGETLLVRFAEYLKRNNIEFLAVCAADSFINSELRKIGIPIANIAVVSHSPDFYYCNDTGRQLLVQDIARRLPIQTTVRVVTFCMRDLYTAVALSRAIANISITHLVLHIQDDLYVGQTLLDKLVYVVAKKRNFSEQRIIRFNRDILRLINSKGGLIIMADLIARFWRKNFGLQVRDCQLVPIPSFAIESAGEARAASDKKILWIGRIVDFKIPALMVMIEYVSLHPEYTLTIIGAGDVERIQQLIEKKKLDASRVEFVGEVSYSELSGFIKSHSIGYAMGTSLVELAKYKLPVIIALASYDHEYFTRRICGGIFYDKPIGCDGSDLVLTSESEIPTSIDDSVRFIEENYRFAADACYEYAREQYSMDRNFEKYLYIINKADVLGAQEAGVTLPKASLLRRSLYRLISR